MDYQFEGSISISPSLRPRDWLILSELSRTRRMKRDSRQLPDPPFWFREWYRNIASDQDDEPWGKEGIFYTSLLSSLWEDPKLDPEEYHQYVSERDSAAKSENPGVLVEFGQNDLLGVKNSSVGMSEIGGSLWNAWMPSEDGRALVWNETENPREFVEWLDFLRKVLVAQGYNLDGEIFFQGDEWDDHGSLVVTNERVEETDRFLESLLPEVEDDGEE